MNLLLTFALSAVMVAPARPGIEPDSGSVAFTTAAVWLRVSPAFASERVALLPEGAQVRIIRCEEQTCNVEFRRLQGYVLRELLRAAPAPNPVNEQELDPPSLPPEDALSILMNEHRLSVPLPLLELAEHQPEER